MFSHSPNYGRGVLRQRMTRSMLWLALSATLLSGAGCRVWRTDRGSEGVVPVVEPRQELRVTRTDSSQVVLRNIVVSRDTLFGMALADQKGIAIPLADIATVERRKVNRPLVIAMVGVGAVTLGLLYLLRDFSLDTGFPAAR